MVYNTILKEAFIYVREKLVKPVIGTTAKS